VHLVNGTLLLFSGIQSGWHPIY